MVKKKRGQMFSVQLKELDFPGEWTLSTTSWGKLENVSKDTLYTSSVKRNYNLESIVEENLAQEISNIIFD